jgi:hypothetical protein
MSRWRVREGNDSGKCHDYRNETTKTGCRIPRKYRPSIRLKM